MPGVWFQKIKHWLPSSFWGLCVLLASSIPGQDLPKLSITYLDKVAHLGLYGILGFLLARVPLPFYWALGVAALFGMMDELYQTLTPHRSSDLLDWTADVLGACLGILVARWFLRQRNDSNK